MASHFDGIQGSQDSLHIEEVKIEGERVVALNQLHHSFVHIELVDLLRIKYRFSIFVDPFDLPYYPMVFD